MKPFQQQIRACLLETQAQKSSERVPSWLRNLLRATSGGDHSTATFVRAILWKYRWLSLLVFVANVGVGIAETLKCTPA